MSFGLFPVSGPCTRSRQVASRLTYMQSVHGETHRIGNAPEHGAAVDLLVPLGR